MTDSKVAEALIERLNRTGYKRLEIYRPTPTAQVNGYCVRGDGTSWYFQKTEGERN